MKPGSRLEKFLAKIAGYDVKISPKSKKEYWLNEIAKNKGSGGSALSIVKPVNTETFIDAKNLVPVGAGAISYTKDIAPIVSEVFQGETIDITINGSLHAGIAPTQPAPGMWSYDVAPFLGISVFSKPSTCTIFVMDESLHDGFALSISSGDKKYLDNAQIVPESRYEKYIVDVTDLMPYMPYGHNVQVTINGVLYSNFESKYLTMTVYDDEDNSIISLNKDEDSNRIMIECDDPSLFSGFSIIITGGVSMLDKTVREIYELMKSGPVFYVNEYNPYDEFTGKPVSVSNDVPNRYSYSVSVGPMNFYARAFDDYPEEVAA